MRKILSILSIFVLIAFLSSQVVAKKNNIHFKTSAQPSVLQVKAGEKFSLLYTLTFDKGWHSYSMKEQVGPEGLGPTKTEITVHPPSSLKISGAIKSSKPKIKFDSAFLMKVETYYGKATFEIPVVAKKNLDFTRDKAFVTIYIQQCTEEMCLPGMDDTTRIGSEVYSSTMLNQDMAETAQPQEQLQQGTDNKKSDAQIEPAKNGAQATESHKEIEAKKKEGVWSFLWFAMTAGALALLTPCVFPMVPITVSFFTKRAESSKGKGLRDSIVYAIGIISTFTAIGLILALAFGASGIQSFATNPIINLCIAAIFVIFALNLFGAFEIQLPTSLLNKLNAKSQGSGIISVLLMGLTFSLTSFTCTVPFVGSALISAAGGEWFYPILGMLGFSAVFAAPFFFLALFPSAMKKLPKAGGWMNNVKVVMGFLEIAAAIKFISNADLVWSLGIMPRDLFLGIWIGSSILITIYILGLFRLKHDSPVDSVGTMRVVFAIFFASISFYLVAGLNGKPLGEIDAFLPPPDYSQIMSSETSASAVSVTSDGKKTVVDEAWISDYKAALAKAKEENKLLFLDFSGFTCTNCRWMELNMFPKQQVKGLMDQMIKVRLFTDRREEPYLSNKNMQQNRYNSVELPLYVILTPDEKMLGTKAFTRSESEFVNFLSEALKKK